MVAIAQARVPRADQEGRVQVAEILVNIPAVGHLIRDGTSHQIATMMQADVPMEW